jgi:hypothetical protein
MFAVRIVSEARRDLPVERVKSRLASLFETGACAGGLGSKPLVELFLGLDDQAATGHGGMGITTKLGAIDLISPGLGWFEPNRHPHARDGVLRDAHGNDFEGMDDVLGADIRENGFVDDDVDFVINLDIIFAVGIGWIDAEHVCRADQAHILFSELGVLASIASIPVELLGDDLDNG